MRSTFTQQRKAADHEIIGTLSVLGDEQPNCHSLQHRLVSECTGKSECVMALVQGSAFDFLPVSAAALEETVAIAIYDQVNRFDVEKRGHSESVRRLGAITPTPPSGCEALDKHQRTVARRSRLRGAEFDKHYFDCEVEFHRQPFYATCSMAFSAARGVCVASASGASGRRCLRALLCNNLPKTQPEIRRGVIRAIHRLTHPAM